jgi:GT2 family glycosyltransferase
MDMSIVISTRDRGSRLVPTVQSLLADDTCPAEVIIVDQSASDSSQAALDAEGLLEHARVVYRRSTTTGLSRGRNEGVRLATGEVIAFTDDDCIAGLGWGSRLWATFGALPDAAVVYGSVLAGGSVDSGWIPVFHPLREGQVQPGPGIIRDLGIGANFGIRRSTAIALGPFDVFLGAGARFSSAEDTDFGYRALLAGLHVYVVREPSVLHHGLRQGSEVHRAAVGYVRGMTAMAMKHIRCGDTLMVAVLARDMRRRLGDGVSALLRTGRPSGLGKSGVTGQLMTMAASCQLGIERRRRLYRSSTSAFESALDSLATSGSV